MAKFSIPPLVPSDHVTYLLRLLDEARTQRNHGVEWQPIETLKTPAMDRKIVLVGRWDQGMPTLYTDYWCEEEQCLCDSSAAFLPTHWLDIKELPDPPETRKP